jgi:hypothetical protein
MVMNLKYILYLNRHKYAEAVDDLALPIQTGGHNQTGAHKVKLLSAEVELQEIDNKVQAL